MIKFFKIAFGTLLNLILFTLSIVILAIVIPSKWLVEHICPDSMHEADSFWKGLFRKKI